MTFRCSFNKYATNSSMAAYLPMKKLLYHWSFIKTHYEPSIWSWREMKIVSHFPFPPFYFFLPLSFIPHHWYPTENFKTVDPAKGGKQTFQFLQNKNSYFSAPGFLLPLFRLYIFSESGKWNFNILLMQILIFPPLYFLFFHFHFALSIYARTL